MRGCDIPDSSFERSDKEVQESEEDSSQSSGEQMEAGCDGGSNRDTLIDLTILQPKAGTFIGEPDGETKFAMCLKAKVRKLLDSMEISGESISRFVMEIPVNPGLVLKDFGFVGLPISRQSVDALFEFARTNDPARIQHGCLNFPENSLNFTHPAWTTTVANISSKLSEALFLRAETVFVHPRLVICPAGESPTRALQTFQDEHALGRVLITLPCINNGISLQVSSEGDSVDLSLAAEQCFASLEAVWLRSSAVNAPPLREGVFAAVIYDLIDSDAGSELAINSLSLGDQAATLVTELRGLLDTWFESPPKESYHVKTLAYQLPQLHDDNTLELSNLDAEELGIFRCLRRACEGTPYTVFLANISRQIKGSRADDDIGDGVDVDRTPAPSTGQNASIYDFDVDSINISHLIGSDGQHLSIAKTAKFDRSWFIQDDVYCQSRDPDEEDEVEVDEYRYRPGKWDDDDEGETVIKHSYNDTVVLLASPPTLVDLLVRFASDTATYCSRYIREANANHIRNPENKGTWLLLRLLCERLVDQRSSAKMPLYPWDRHSLNYSLLRDEELAAVVDAMIAGMLNAEKAQILLKVIEAVDLSSSTTLPILARLIAVLDFGEVANRLDIAVRRVPTLQSRLEALIKLEKLCEETSPSKHPQLRDWITQHLVGACRDFDPHRTSYKTTAMSYETFLNVASSREGDTFMTEFLKPGVSFKYYQALLHGFLSQRDNTFAQSQVPRFVESLISVIESGVGIDTDSPIVGLIDDIRILQSPIAHRLLDALVSSPAMSSSSGIPAAYESRRGDGLGLAHGVHSDPACSSPTDRLLYAILINFYVFEVGLSPSKPSTWRRCPLRELESTREGQQINAFLNDPISKSWTSANWGAQERDFVLRILTRVDGGLMLDHNKVKVRGTNTQQLLLSKTDKPWQTAYTHWEIKLRRYRNLHLRVHNSRSFVRSSEYAFLTFQDWKRMLDRTVVAGSRRGPVYGRKYFVPSHIPAKSTDQALAKLLQRHGGRMISAVQVDGPEVLAVVPTTDSGDHNIEWTGALRYWQPGIISEAELRRQLQVEEDLLPYQGGDILTSTPPTVERPTGLPENRKRKHNDPEPLEANDNLAGLGSHKRHATEKTGKSRKTTEVVDLC